MTITGTSRGSRQGNPAWVWDEIVLACDLLRSHGWRGLRSDHRDVIELSRLLQLLPLHPEQKRGETFRNPAGVARKTWDIATQHSEYTGKQTKGNKLDGKVLDAFLERPAVMHAAAEALRAGLDSGALTRLPQVAEEDDEGVSAPEGRLLLRQHVARERDSKLRTAKIKSVLGRAGTLACEVCSFDFERAYGPRGAGYIECHHVIPLHVSGPTTTSLDDLVLICSNCHRMIHRSAPWPTPAELRGLVLATQSRLK
ncbi:HNH endonuclease [Nonomuraea indica]|uniref:HNH endonuclease n=1 Tax=Nonomuraea indica TaxID=1581193 RepID=UPI001C5F8D3B|nr:HNH endonuclease [Nonomuraea indica]